MSYLFSKNEITYHIYQRILRLHFYFCHKCHLKCLNQFSYKRNGKWFLYSPEINKSHLVYNGNCYNFDGLVDSYNARKFLVRLNKLQIFA